MTSISTYFSLGSRIRRPRALGILAASALLVGLTYVSVPARPGVPSGSSIGDRDTIGGQGGAAIALAPDSLAQIDRSIKVWAANLAAEPLDFLSATALAGLYHARGQLSGDLADHERALEAARTAARIAPTEPAAKALEAAILYTLHDFSGALATAEALYRGDPSHLGALATMADSKVELGRIDDARGDYARLASQASGPAIDIRLARLAFVTGQPDEALRLARSARAAARTEAQSSATVDLGFYEFAAGEYARLSGDAEAARAGFTAALGLRATDLGSLIGLARVDAFEGRTNEAITGLRTAAAVAPMPETLALLGDILATTGDTAGAAVAHDTVQFIERLGSIQAMVNDRVLLRFELDHDSATPEVLATARASLTAQPDSAGHDLVAWALYRLGRFDEAAIELAAARTNGADDARLRFHDGAIAVARGDRHGGVALLESALADGPALDPIERAEVERLLGR